LQVAEARHNSLQIMQILLLQALAYQAHSRMEEALAMVERAVLLARPGGFVRAFVDGGPPMADLLARLAGRDGAPEFVRQLLAAFPDLGAGSPDAGQELTDPLTKRELQTLQLLSTHRSVEEIAAEMVVSVATVRSHTKRIYSKLNVNSRLQATQRAKELGLHSSQIALSAPKYPKNCPK
jgi:LuxR family maltose regulon positive regulatory protein